MFDTEGVNKTLAAIEPERLRSLELIFTGDGPIVSVASHAGLGGLRELYVKGIRDRIDVADVIGKSTTLKELRVLLLESCAVDAGGVARLCHAPFVTSLERLELVSCGLTNNAAMLLAREFPMKSSLSHLDLTGNHFSGAGLRALQTRFGERLKGYSGERPWPTRFYL